MVLSGFWEGFIARRQMLVAALRDFPKLNGSSTLEVYRDAALLACFQAHEDSCSGAKM